MPELSRKSLPITIAMSIYAVAFAAIMGPFTWLGIDSGILNTHVNTLEVLFLLCSYLAVMVCACKVADDLENVIECAIYGVIE
jgi:hypothetical protein